MVSNGENAYGMVRGSFHGGLSIQFAGVRNLSVWVYL